MILFAFGIIAIYIIAVSAGLKKGFSAGSMFGMTIGFGIITLGVLALTLGLNCPWFNWWSQYWGSGLPC